MSSRWSADGSRPLKVKLVPLTLGAAPLSIVATWLVSGRVSTMGTAWPARPAPLR